MKETDKKTESVAEEGSSYLRTTGRKLGFFCRQK
jgi:hypothetical protein